MSTEKTNAPSAHGRIRSLFALRLLLPLLVVDLALIAFSVVHEIRNGVDVLDPSPWLLETDGGYSEIWGYALEAALFLSLLVLAAASRRAIWASWGVLFAAALADDKLRLHERKGAWLAEKLHFPDGVLGMRANDLGEIFVWGLLAVVPLGAAVLLYRRSNRWTRRASIGMAGLVAVYVFFGGVVDQLHVLVLGGALEGAMGTVEDGGELIVLSVILSYVVPLLRRVLQARRSPSAGSDADPAPDDLVGS